MAVVYDKKTGEALTCQAVDARELVESGAYTNEPAEKVKADESKDEAKLTADEIKAKLDEAGVEYLARASKAELQKMLDELDQ